METGGFAPRVLLNPSFGPGYLGVEYKFSKLATEMTDRFAVTSARD
jgi:hypothetical protein